MQHADRWEFDDVVVDLAAYRVLKNGRQASLGPRAFDVLVYLLRHAGRLVEKQEFFDALWSGAAVTDNALTRAVREVRAAIGDDARQPSYIETVARRGYRFVASVRPVESRARVMVAVLPFSDHSRHAVRRHGDCVRVTTQLIDVHDQTHVWSNSYEEELGDLAPSRVAEAVARAIRIEIRPEHRRSRAAQLSDPEAYAEYLKGRYLWNRRSADGSREAMAAFQRAVTREPTFAAAHAGLARCYMTFIVGLSPRSEAQPLARSAVLRAIELDARLAEAHAILGALESIDGNLAAAEEAFRRAIMLDPNDAGVRHWYAMHSLVESGRFEDALEELRIAQGLDPLALILHADIAAVYYLMREPARALDQCRRVLDLDPTFARAHVYAGWVHSQNGDIRAALAAFEAAKRLDDSPWNAGWLGYGLGKAGRGSEARHILDGLRRQSRLGREVAFLEALVHLGLGDMDRALENLGKAREEKSLGFGVVEYMPTFDDLRRDPRFEPRLRRLSREGASRARQASRPPRSVQS